MKYRNFAIPKLVDYNLKTYKMGKGFFQVPTAINEPVKSYAPGSPEREAVSKQYKEYFNGSEDVPMYIGSEEVKNRKH